MLFMVMIQQELSLIIFLVMDCQMEPRLLIWVEELLLTTTIGLLSGTNQLENNIAPGTHSVTVTDVNNCSEIMTVTLLEPDALVVNGSSSGDFNLFPGGFDISCKGLNDGECYIDPYGGVQGTAGYMYSWSGPINGQISNLDEIVNLYVGTYSVTVTDANGCTDVQTFTLTEPTEEFVSVTHMINCWTR